MAPLARARGSVTVLIICLMPVLRGEGTASAQMFLKAVSDDNLKTIEALLSYGFDPDMPLRGFTPLYLAIQMDRPSVVEVLLEHHANPNASVTVDGHLNGERLLHFAIESDKLRIAGMLLHAGADINIRTRTGRTPLHLAGEHVRLDAIRFLMERGADVNARDNEGASALDEAVWRGSLDTVAILLVHGASLNGVDTATGATPINEAAFMGRDEIVEYLLRLRPDLTIADKNGRRPLDNAIRMRKAKSALLLLKAEPSELETPEFFAKTMEAAERRELSSVVDGLLKRGASTNGLLPSGATPLGLAASIGTASVVQALLDNGADVNLSGKNGATALEEASLRGFASIAVMLVDHGADVNRVNTGSGSTALYAAASFGKIEVVKLLLDHGANPTLCGKNGRTPFQAARENGFADTAAMLHDRGGAGSCTSR